MKNFTYYQPQSVEQAVGLLSAKWGSTELLAGGTDLLDLQKEYIAQPDKVISLTGIKGLSGHSGRSGGAADPDDRRGDQAGGDRRASPGQGPLSRP